MGFKSSSPDISEYQANQYRLATQMLENPYDPDIAGLQSEARKELAQNAQYSKELEEKYAPGVASTRNQLQSQIADDLATEGQLDTATQNNIIRSGLADSLAAGTGTRGVNSTGSKGVVNNLLQGTYQRRLQNQQKAASLLASNPLPAGGLDPASTAALTSSASQANYQNPYNLANNAYNTAAALKVQNTNAQNQNLASLYAAAMGLGGSAAGGYLAGRR